GAQDLGRTLARARRRWLLRVTFPLADDRSMTARWLERQGGARPGGCSTLGVLGRGLQAARCRAPRQGGEESPDGAAPVNVVDFASPISRQELPGVSSSRTSIIGEDGRGERHAPRAPRRRRPVSPVGSVTGSDPSAGTVEFT